MKFIPLSEEQQTEGAKPLRFVPLPEAQQPERAKPLRFVPLAEQAPPAPVASTVAAPVASTVAAPPTQVAPAPAPARAPATTPVAVAQKAEAQASSFTPWDEFKKGVKGGLVGLKSMPNTFGMAGISDVLVATQKRIDILDKIDSGQVKSPREARLLSENDPSVGAYFASDPAMRARIRQGVTNDLVRNKQFLSASMDAFQRYKKEAEQFEGKTEKLTDVRSPTAFGNWLAKSWGVQNGKPQTFYHATTKDFDTFNTSGTGFASALGMAYEVERHGSFFAVDPKFAEGFIEDLNTGRVKEGGRVLPVHLSIQSPIDLRDDALSRMLSDEETVEEFKANDIDLRSIYNHFYELERWELFDGPEGAEFIDNLQKLGFDGAIINESIPNDSNAKSGQVWVAFSPNQVKSVYNRGSFSPDDSRLTKETAQADGK